MNLLVESSDVLPLADVEIAFPVGSLEDPPGREGLLQLAAHLMRRGPKGVSQARFEDELARLGARVSVEVSMRATRFRATVLRRNLEPLFSTLANLVWDPALRSGDFTKLKRQAEAALLSRLDDDQTLGALHFGARSSGPTRTAAHSAALGTASAPLVSTTRGASTDEPFAVRLFSSVCRATWIERRRSVSWRPTFQSRKPCRRRAQMSKRRGLRVAVAS